MQLNDIQHLTSRDTPFNICLTKVATLAAQRMLNRVSLAVGCLVFTGAESSIRALVLKFIVFSTMTIVPVVYSLVAGENQALKTS